MSIFEILGPVMVGPSSSHTAGAVRIGSIARQLLGAAPAEAAIHLHGSFAATGMGHGTDRAIVAGLLGMEPDDRRIPQSFEEAEKAGLRFTIDKVDIRDAHPNTAELVLSSADGRRVTVQASSIGGGRICVNKLDGVSVNFSGESNTLVVYNEDRPGLVADVSSLVACTNVNIATLQLFRDKRGGTAVMVLEIDHALPEAAMKLIENLSGVVKAIYIHLRREGEEE